MKKIIVTGGMGFIGSNLIKYLIEKKYFIINIDNLSYSSTKLFHRELSNNKNYVFYKLDLNNRKKIIKILKKYKPQGIFNLAAETHVDKSINAPDNFVTTNVLGTYNLLQASLNFFKSPYVTKNFCFHHISTDEVYGSLKKNEISFNEDSKYKPNSPYSASKASADHLIQAYIRTYKIDAVISKCCNNYGPFQFPEKLIPKIIFNIFNNKTLPVYAKGLNIREWIFVTDHCDALYKLYLKGKSGESYNVGSNINLKNLDLIKKILKICKKQKIIVGKKSKISFIKDRPGHDFRYAIDCSKIKKQLKWNKVTNIDKGLSQTIKWYFENQRFFKITSSKIFNKRLGLKL